MISTVNLSVQFGEKPLFENVSINFLVGVDTVSLVPMVVGNQRL